MYASYIENGRRYQTKREGEHWGLSDEQQFESMQAANLLCIIVNSHSPTPKSLFNSPHSDNAQNILDIRTDNGAWAIAVADRFPSGRASSPSPSHSTSNLLSRSFSFFYFDCALLIRSLI